MQDFLSSSLRDQLGLDECGYKKARDYLAHFELAETREAELDSGVKVAANKLSSAGENLYCQAVVEPGGFQFQTPEAAVTLNSG